MCDPRSAFSTQTPPPYHARAPPPPYKKPTRKTVEEKLQERYATHLTEIQQETQYLLQIQTKLQYNHALFFQAIHNFQSDIEQINEKLSSMEQTQKEIATLLAQETQIDIDKHVNPPDTLSQQFLEEKAKYASFEDLMYYLDRSLQMGTMELDTYTKLIRTLAREQFTCRYTCQKIRTLQQQQIFPPTQ